MLMSIDLDYRWEEIVKNLTDEKYHELRKAIPQLQLKDPRKDVFPWIGEFYADDYDMQILSDLGIEFKVKRVKGIQYPEWFRNNGVPKPEQVSSITYQISIANLGLLSINEVHFEEDCCTYHLQTLLNEGWRILAVCPPNDSRRPTYILGRTKYNDA